ncbi:MFS general substrate transporter, partial [Acaromyces ingoldii]
LGFALGPLLFGPLAFLIGGRSVYIGTYLCFTAFSFGISEARNIQTVIVCRFFAGVMGSSSLNNTVATIGQFTTPTQLTQYSIWYALAAFGGPGLGPVIAAFVDHRAGFRWNLRMQAIFVAICTVACFLCIPQLGTPALWQKNIGTGESKKKSSFIWATCKRALLGPFVWLATGKRSSRCQRTACTVLYINNLARTEPVVLVICIYLSLLYGILYGFFEVFPYVFRDIRQWSGESTGLIFISLLVGFFAAVVVVLVPQRLHEKKVYAMQADGKMPPETKLQQMLWAGALPPIGLFIFAWTAPFTSVHWFGAAFGMALFALGMMVIFTALIPYLVAYAGSEAPLALAASTFTRAAFGASFPLFSVQMYKGMTVQGASSMLAGLALLLVPLPWVLKKYGPKLRAKSRRMSS